MIRSIRWIDRGNTRTDPPGGRRFVGTALYVVVGAAITLLCALQARHSIWVGDFFPHVAAVRELAAHPWNPTHPMLPLDSKHAFFSPYHLLVGLSSRVLHVPPVDIFGVFGVLNVVVLLYALRRFVVRLSRVDDVAATLALLFVFFVWDRTAWMWSGFVHWHVLAFVAPYPSTLAIGLTFLALSLQVEGLSRAPLRTAAFSVLIALCFLIHPITAVALVLSAGVLFLARTERRSWREGLLLAGSIGAGVTAAAAWPYFSVISLMTSQSAEFTEQSAELYVAPWQRVWPALLLSPLVIRRALRNWHDELVLLVLATLAVYVLGGMTQAFALGRFIAWAVMFGQIAAAVEIVALPAWVGPVAALLPLALVVSDTMPLHRATNDNPQVWQLVRHVVKPVASNDVMLSDLQTGEQACAVTGRLVASYTPQYWVRDTDERRRAVSTFFDPQSSDEDRRKILAQYGVKWVLLNQLVLPFDNAELARVARLGHVVVEAGPVTLIDVSRTPE